MDRNTILQQFDRMETAVEALVTRIASIQVENRELIARIKVLEKNMVKKEDEAKSFQKEKDLIRAKIDGLLAKLGDFNKA